MFQVKRGDYPVLGARVEVVATHPGRNGSGSHWDKFELLDTGSGGNYNRHTLTDSVMGKFTIKNSAFYFNV